MTWYRLNLCNRVAKPWMSLVVVFLEAMTLGAIATVLPDIYTDFFGSLSETSLISGIFGSASAVVSFFVVPWLGGLSDKIGRQGPMLISVICGVIPVFLLAGEANLWIYFGFTSIGSLSVFGLTMAYIADVTSLSDRAKWYGGILTSAYLALICGAIPSLFLSRHWICITGAIVCGVNCLYIFLFVPESLLQQHLHYESLAENGAAHDRPVYEPKPTLSGPTAAEVAFAGADLTTQTEGEKLAAAITTDSDSAPEKPSYGTHPRIPQAEPAGAEHTIAKYGIFTTLKYAAKSRFMRIMATTLFFSSLGEVAVLNTILLYLSRILDFSTSDLGTVVIVIGLSALLSMILFYGLFIRKLGERGTIILSISVNTLRVLFYIFLTEKWQIYVLEAFAGIGLMSFAASGSLTSRMVPKTEQGIAQGALAGIRQMCSGIGPVLFSGVFSYFVSDSAFSYFPQAPFVLGTVVLSCGVLAACFLPKNPEPNAFPGLLPPGTSNGNGTSSNLAQT